MARFSHESILKQEEALSELDASIDDWVSKLEQAENRRTRVRQKLLEHVAGALIMVPQGTGVGEHGGDEVRGVGMSPVGGMAREVDTPPRSPTKSQSPQRLAAQVEVETLEETNRRDVESIRIYADSDVYALLADVEDEINRMGEESGEKERRVETTEAIRAGLTLNAVAFDGLHAGRREEFV